MYQAQALLDMQGTNLVPDTAYVEDSPNAQFIMSLLAGHSLRDQLKSSMVQHKVVMQICQAMMQLESHISPFAHKDLKPENIFLCDDGSIKLLDPGYFGLLGLVDGSERQVCITTPEFYPFLRSFDLLAFGYILWECLTGIHPLVRPLSSGIVSEHTIGSSVINAIEAKELVGNYYFDALRHLPLPSAANLNIDKELEQLLLKAIGLTLTDENKLETTKYFQSFSELYGALSRIDAPEIWETAPRITYFPPEPVYAVEPDLLFGIKGLTSFVDGSPDYRPFRLKFLELFAQAGKSELSCQAMIYYGDITVIVDAGESSEDYRLGAVFESNQLAQNIYVLLNHSGERTDEDRVKSYFVTRVKSPGVLAAIEENEFAQVVDEAIKLLETGPPFDQMVLLKAFGEIKRRTDLL
jgi:serine/threonine protein kinase